jgi:hypothetical protein
MKKIIRLTESDLHNLIQRSVLRVLREQDENFLLQSIAQSLVQQQLIANQGRNEIEVRLQGDAIAQIEYVVESDPYMRQDMRSSSYDVPDGSEGIIDNPTIEVVEVVVCKDGECLPIQDNGIIQQTLEKNVEIDYSGGDIPSEQDYFSEY